MFKMKASSRNAVSYYLQGMIPASTPPQKKRDRQDSGAQVIEDKPAAPLKQKKPNTMIHTTTQAR